MRSWRVIGVLTALLFPTVLSAQLYAAVPSQGISLQISPLPIEINAEPGTSAESDLRVQNAGSEAEQLTIRLLAVHEDDNGNVRLTAPTPTDEWTHWVTFSQTTFPAPAGQWMTIRMYVSVPKTAAFGYYFAVEFRRAADAQPQPGQTATNGGVATFVLLNADAPGAKREAQIVSFVSDHRSYEFLPATFTAKVRSTGNVHVAPHGNVFITRGSEQVGSAPVNAAAGNVLPGGSRFFPAKWDDGFPYYETKLDASGQPLLDKKGKPVQSLKWDFSKVNHLRIGHYTAKLVMVYDNGQRDVPMEAVVSFWVIPWRILAGLGIVILFAGLGILATFWRLGRLAVQRTKRVKTNSNETGGSDGLDIPPEA